MSYITQFEAGAAGGITGVLGGDNINITGASPVVTVNLNETIHWPDTNAGATTGVIFLGGAGGAGGTRYFHNFTAGAAVGSGFFNIFVGDRAGNFTNSSTLGDNVGLGSRCLQGLTSGAANDAVGADALRAVTSGSFNEAMGFNALRSLLTGSENLALGPADVALVGTGGAYTGAESHNILLSNNGVVGDNNTMRLGTDGSGTRQVDTTFIAGVRSVAVLADALPMVIDSTFQVGTGVIPVTSGGTGLTTLTDGGVLLGSGTADVTVTAVGTDGQELLGATGADPEFATLTSADGTIVFAVGPNTLDLITGGDVAISFPTDAGTATPALGVLTVAGGTNIATSGAGSTVTVAFSGTLPVASGGSGRTTSTAFAVICGGTAATTPHQSIASVGTAAQVLTSNGAGALPTFQDASGGGGITWAEVVGTTQAMDVDTGYVANNAGLVTLTLPDTAAFGSIVRVVGKGAGSWTIAQNAGESIRWDEASVTTVGVGGSISATDDHDAIELVCMTADTEWVVLSSKGNITIV